MLLHPSQFGRCKSWKDDIARHTAKERVAVHLCGFHMAARVVPQNAGPQHIVCRVQQGGAMHMARQANATHSPQTMGRELVQHSLGGGDPAVGGLLAPAVMGALDGQGGRGLGQDLLIGVDQNAL